MKTRTSTVEDVMWKERKTWEETEEEEEVWEVERLDC
jgi:hypothetical protein